MKKMNMAGDASMPNASPKEGTKRGRLHRGSVMPDYPEGDCLKPFKGQRAGAMRAGSTKIAGYPDESKEGNGHPGAHQA